MKVPARTLATAALLALCAGCRRGTPPEQGRLVIGQITSAVTLDPYAHDQLQTLITLGHFYNSLVTFGPEMQVQPELAVAWENPSETLWRFHLRQGVVFHDGSPFGAQDVVVSIRRALLPDSQVRHYVQAVEDIRAVDDATVELVTRHPAPVLLNKLVFVSMVPRATGSGSIERPVGTGPYRFVAGRPGATIEAERFERFWGPPPAFPHVAFVSLREPRERAEAVPRGRADLVTQFPIEEWERGRQQPNTRLESRQGLGAVLLTFSLRTAGRFADPRVRRAVAVGLDRRRIVAEGMRGLGVPLDQVVPPSVVGYSSQLTTIDYDPAAAARLLREAGVATGFDAPLVVTASQEDVGREVVKQLGALGIRLQMTVLPTREFYERWSREEIPLSLVGWSAETGDASASLEPLFHSPQGAYGGLNHMSYANPELDRLIELADQTLRPSDRKDHLATAMQILRDDLPVVPLALRFDLYAVRKDLDWRPRLDQFVRASEARPAEGSR